MSEFNSPIERVLMRLENVRKSGSGFKACCPAHNDTQPSLSVAEGDDGRVLLRCHAGCSTGEVCRAIGLKFEDLFASDGKVEVRKPSKQAKQPLLWESVEQVKNVLEKVQNAKVVGEWVYKDASGKEKLRVVRLDNEKGKTYRPIYPVCEGSQCVGWRIGDPQGMLPLYRLTEVQNANTVYLCEGEKAADAAREVGLVATTSAHGAKAADKTDWLPLAGKDVVVLPDHDEAGRKYAKQVIEILSKLEPQPRIKVVELDGLCEKEDVFDYVSFGRMGGMTNADIKHAIELEANARPWLVDSYVSKQNSSCSAANKEITQARLEPREELAIATQNSSCSAINKEIAEARLERKEELAVATQNSSCSDANKETAQSVAFRPMPLDCLPSVLASFVETAGEAIGCDPAYIGVPMLSSLGSAVGTKARLELKQGWTEPGILWTAVVGHSGTQKSPALELAIAGVRKREQEAMQVYLAECERYEQARLCYERDLAAWKRSKDGAEPPAKPEEPVAERFICGDVTVESLAPLLQNNPQGMLVMRDELSGWIGSFDRYSAGKGADASQWLEMYGGRSFTIDRKTGTPKTIFVKHAAASVTGGIQPAILRDSLGGSLVDNGMVARIFFTMPPARERAWSDCCVTDEMKANVQRVFNLLYSLQHEEDVDGELKAVIIRMTDEAKQVWGEFFNEHQQERRGLPSALAAAWSKLEGGTARLALVLHLTRWAAGEITAEEMYSLDAGSVKAAIKLSAWFKNEARRVYALLTKEQTSSKQESRIELVRRKGGAVTVREWQRSRSIKTATAARSELEELVSGGVGQWVEVGSSSKGGASTRKFVLN